MIYMDKRTLIAINDNAIRKNRNRTLIPEKVKELSDTLFPVVFNMVHNDDEIRCQLMLNAEGATAWLDMPIGVFNKLPNTKLGFHSSIEFEHDVYGDSQGQTLPEA